MNPFGLSAMPLPAHTISSIFRSGDLTGEDMGRIRPRHVGQYWAARVCAKDAARAVDVHRDLLRHGGGTHAADRFLMFLEALRDCPAALWRHEVLARRRAVPLPG